MSISERIISSIERASWIRKMFEQGSQMKKKYGAENVFDFSLGNPNLDPPSKLKKMLIELAQDSSPGQHGYMENAGYLNTRQAVAAITDWR